MNAIDNNILQFFIAGRVEWLSKIFVAITYLGDYLAVIGISVVAVLVFYYTKHRDKILPVIISVFGSAASVYVIKHIFFRARPEVSALVTETSSSFPSGHATMAAALYGFLIYAICKSGKCKKIPAILLAVLILLIGISRIYLGVHYPSDVLAGYILGFAWVYISPFISKLIRFFMGRRGHGGFASESKL